MAMHVLPQPAKKEKRMAVNAISTKYSFTKDTYGFVHAYVARTSASCVFVRHLSDAAAGADEGVVECYQLGGAVGDAKPLDVLEPCPGLTHRHQELLNLCACMFGCTLCVCSVVCVVHRTEVVKFSEVCDVDRGVRGW